MHPRRFGKLVAGGKPGKAGLLLAFLMGVGIAASPPLPAVAESRRALVMVSVRVVESCRVETSNGSDGNSMNLKMRCNSRAHPSLGLTQGSQPVAAVGTVSVPRSQIATSENGKILSIEF